MSFLVLTGLVSLAVQAGATPIVCSSSGFTLAYMQTNIDATYGVSCQADDVLFSNITLTGNYGSAANVQITGTSVVGTVASLQFKNTTPPVGGVAENFWSGANNGMTISYDISILDPNYFSTAQLQGTFLNPLSTTKVEMILSNGTSADLIVKGAPLLSQSAGADVSGSQSFHVSNTLTLPATSKVQTVTDIFYESAFATVPEPGASALVGGALLGLGVLLKRRKRA